MKEEYSFAESVLDNLKLGYEMIMMSLRNESIAYKILKEASEEFEVIQAQNLKKIRDQIVSDNKLYYERIHSTKKNRKQSRKESGRRVYHPTGSYLFYYLIKEKLAVEERNQEVLGNRPDSAAIMFRFFHNLFENDNFLKGAFVPITALFEILLDISPRIVSKISAHLHGIDEDLETRHRDYRDYKFFAKTGATLIRNSNNRFSGLDFFKKIPNNEQKIHSELKEQLNEDISPLIEFVEADGEMIKLVEKILGFLAPWGINPLTPSDIPKYNLSYSRIPKLVHKENDPIDEREIETLRSASAMNLKFVEALLSNDSVRKNNMSMKFYVPVVNRDGNSHSQKLESIPDFDEKFILDIAYSKLSRPLKFQWSKNFSYSVEVDQKEVAKIDSIEEKSEIVIPADARKLSVKAKVIQDDSTEKSLLLSVIPLTLISLKAGEAWISESELLNNYHLMMKLLPVMDASGNMESITLSIDFHNRNECKSKKKGLFNKVSTTFYKLKELVWGDLVPKPVENFFHTLSVVGLFSEPKAKRDSIKGTISFAILVNLTTLMILPLLFLVKKRFFDSLMMTEVLLITTIIVVSLIFIIKSFLAKGDGINTIARFCNRFSFLSGIISIVLLVSLFTNSWNRLKSVEIKTGFDDYAVLSQPESNASGQDSRSFIPAVQNASVSNSPDISEASLDLQEDTNVNEESEEQNVIESSNVWKVDVKLPPVVKYVSEPINVDNVEKGNSFKAELNIESAISELKNASEELKNASELVRILNAKVTSVDRNSCSNNEVWVTFVIDSPQMNNENPTTSVNNELSIVFDKDQKLSQIELFWKEGEFKYVKPLPAKSNNPRNDQDLPKPEINLQKNEMKGEKLLNKEEDSNSEKVLRKGENSQALGNYSIQ